MIELLILCWITSVILNVYLLAKLLRYDGLIHIFKTDEGGTTFSLDGVDPDKIESMNIVRYKVSKIAE